MLKLNKMIIIIIVLMIIYYSYTKYKERYYLRIIESELLKIKNQHKKDNQELYKPKDNNDIVKIEQIGSAKKKQNIKPAHRIPYDFNPFDSHIKTKDLGRMIHIYNDSKSIWKSI